jgi:alcohol dehydrogenase
MRNIFENLEQIIGEINKYSNVLIITSPGNKNRGYIDEIIDKENKLIFSTELVEGYPTLENIISLTKKYNNKNFDLIISLGGGSVIDTSKLLSIAIHKDNKINIKNYEEFVNFFNNKILSKVFHISIPTTSGSGAESTCFTTIWNFDQKKKISIEHGQIIPDQVYLTSKFLLTLNFDNTLFPGLDAVCHAFDSVLNKNSTIKSKNLAIEALKIFNLRFNKLLLSLDNELLRSEIHNASNLAGQSINITKTSITHALSYPLTMNYGVPHGLACAFFLSEVYKKYKQNLKNPEEILVLDQTAELIDNLNLHKYTKDYFDEIQLDLYRDKGLNSRIDNFFVDLNQNDILEIIKKVNS